MKIILNIKTRAPDPLEDFCVTCRCSPPPTHTHTPSPPPPPLPTFLMVYFTNRFNAVIPCWSQYMLFGLFYDAIYVLLCVILLLHFSVLLALRLPQLGMRELILVLFVRLFDLRVFVFVFPFTLCVWKRAAVCDCGNPCIFLLPSPHPTPTPHVFFLVCVCVWHSQDFSLTFFLQVDFVS